MKGKIIFFIVFLNSLLLLSSQDKIRVAILDFTYSNVNEKIVIQISDYFTSKIADSKAFTVVERKDLKKVIEEQNLQASDQFDQNTAIEIGNFLGSQLVIMGKIERINNKLSITIKGVDTATAEVKFSKNIAPEGTGQLMFDSISLMVSEITADITGENINKNDFAEKQIKIEELNFKINALKMDLISMDVNSNYYNKMKKNYVIALSTTASFFGLSLIGAVTTLILYNQFYEQNIKSVKITEIESTNLYANICYWTGIATAITSGILFVPVMIFTILFIYTSNYTNEIDRKRELLRNFEMEKKKLLSYNFNFEMDKEKLTFGLNIKF
ncbi:MAG TPA: CsgG/HfaB family protein [Spirochaetota bacterium]|nr:CsgG/HfaB family protein [Spirochaetota bacterium]